MEDKDVINIKKEEYVGGDIQIWASDRLSKSKREEKAVDISMP